jgi:hypothetical protein
VINRATTTVRRSSIKNVPTGFETNCRSYFSNVMIKPPATMQHNVVNQNHAEFVRP